MVKCKIEKAISKSKLINLFIFLFIKMISIKSLPYRKAPQFLKLQLMKGEVE